MLDFEGRIAVPSSTGQRVLLGAFERFVAVRDLQAGALTNTFETTFDAGGDRVALSDELNGVLAAAYHVHGLAFYCCSTGREKWRRKDLKKIQIVSLSRDGLTAYCGRESGSLVQVDLESGETKRSIRGARALYESPFDLVQFLDTSKPQLLHHTGTRLYLDRTTFAFLDIAFAPGLVALSESGGPVRCIDIADGTERWRYNPKKGHHVLQLGYRKADSRLFGVEWPFQHGGAKTLVSWSLADGELGDRRILGHPLDCCFARNAEVIVLASGEVFPTTGSA